MPGVRTAACETGTPRSTRSLELLRLFEEICLLISVVFTGLWIADGKRCSRNSELQGKSSFLAQLHMTFPEIASRFLAKSKAGEISCTIGQIPVRSLHSNTQMHVEYPFHQVSIGRDRHLVSSAEIFQSISPESPPPPLLTSR